MDEVVDLVALEGDEFEADGVFFNRVEGVEGELLVVLHRADQFPQREVRPHELPEILRF